MKYANVKQRMYALILDIVVIFAFLALISVMFRETKANVSLWELFQKIKTMDAPFGYFVEMLVDISNAAGIITGILQILFIFIYLIILPIVWPRQTIGRAIFYVKVIKLNEQNLTMGTLIIREFLAKLLLFVFSLGITGIINIFLIVKSEGRRTIHDRMANTLSISARKEEEPCPK